MSKINLIKNNAQTIMPYKNITTTPQEVTHNDNTNLTTIKLRIILEAVLERIEMHQHVSEQRQNWNSLLLNSLNMITLTAAMMAGMSGFSGELPALGLKVASTLLFALGFGILLLMNKLQPSQLAEEQRKAVRLFKKLQIKLGTFLSLQSLTDEDVEEAIEEVLALDQAYPLILLGGMLEKFPNTLKPAKWWPSKKLSMGANPNPNPNPNLYAKQEGVNGWSKELEDEMKQIVEIIDKRDLEYYFKLGNNALKVNKTLATLGPLFMGLGAIGSGFGVHGGSWGGLVAAVAGSMASVVNTIEHGGQVGMVFEIYRNCAGSFNLLGEIIESNLEEKDLTKRENGELFELKMGLQLGRSLCDLREFVSSSYASYTPKGEFASKLL